MTSPDRRDNLESDNNDDDYDRKRSSPKDHVMPSIEPTSSSISNSSGGGSSSGGEGCTLHVSKLNPTTTDTELLEKFSQYGKVTDCIILVDPQTRLSRSFGFVTYTKSEEASDALNALNKSRIDGYVIEVQFARRNTARDPTPGKYMGPERKYGYSRPQYSYPPSTRGGGRPQYPTGAYYPPPTYPPTSKYTMPYPYGYNYGTYPPPPTYPPTYSSYPPKSYDRYSPYVRHDPNRDAGAYNGGGGGGGGGRSSSGSHRDDREYRRDEREGGRSSSSGGGGGGGRSSNSDDREYFSRGRESSSHH